MIVAEIDKDYINSKWDDLPNRVGKKFEMLHDGWYWPKVRFRCKDDDGDIYYGGWLLNDSKCEVQLEVLRWCQNDAGCTTIEVAIMRGTSTDYEWVQEIG